MTHNSERVRAELVSAAIDQLLRDPSARPELSEPVDAAVLDTAGQLAHLPAMLGPVDPVLEQRVMRQVQAGNRPGRRLSGLKPAWAIAGLAAVLLVAMLLTPWGQTAVASFMAVFDLGRTEVRITPVNTPAAPLATAAAGSAGLQQSMTWQEAQTQVPFRLPQPAYLPPGYQMREVLSTSYPDLPAWVPQPLFAELIYEDDTASALVLRVYSIVLGDSASISGLNLQAAPIRDVQDVEINGLPGVLLQLGQSRQVPGWQEVVWEYEDLILALSTTDLAEGELLRIARSVQ